MHYLNNNSAVVCLLVMVVFASLLLLLVELAYSHEEKLLRLQLDKGRPVCACTRP